MNRNVIAGLIAATYIGLALVTADAKTAFQLALFLMLPLGCIWFSDAMGGYTGMGMGRGAITSPTPGCLIAFVGWLLLFLPIILALVL